MKQRIVTLSILCLALAQAAVADEGMWMINRLSDQTYNTMRELGLALTRKDIYNTNAPSLKDAVVDFGDYCSGVFVSAKGLVMTNHHCGYQSLQQLSTTERDILKDGFVAKSQKEELPVSGLFVRVLERTVDLSDYMRRRIEAQPDVDIDTLMLEVEQDYTKQFEDRYVVLKSYFGGAEYHLSIYKVYEDVRLVLAPPSALGKFGGDTDNWMWPRQTCDFCVFRVYGTAKGEPAKYSKKNVPLTPYAHTQPTLEGYQPGDYVMTLGFPGSTSRYVSSYGVDYRVNALNVSLIDVRGKKQEVWKRWMEDREIAIKYANKYAGSSNYWKNSIGMNEAVENLQIIALKQEREEQYADLLPPLKEAYEAAFDLARAYGFLRETFQRGIEIGKAAATYSALPADADSTELAAALESISEFRRCYDARVDQEVMSALLSNLREQVAPEYLPALYQEIDSAFGGDTEAYAQYIFEHTAVLADSIEADSTLRAADPAVRFYESYDEMISDLRARLAEPLQRISDGEDALTRAIVDTELDQPHYSDANFTLRLSYGYVQDYATATVQYPYYTNAASLVAKALTDNDDYKIDDNVVALFKKRDYGRYTDRTTADLHLCFLTNNDITGGNSGSPMFNAKGQLLGLAFDGNWEAMSGDLSFDDDLQRCIGVDVRYILYIIEKWGKADWLIKEMGI